MSPLSNSSSYCLSGKEVELTLEWLW